MEEQKTSIIPNSTQIPNIITDIIIPQIPEAEARCLLYVCRRTFGFHKVEDQISFSQFEKGIQDKNGKKLDFGAGISREAINKALKNLIEAGLLISQKTTKGNFYKINLEINTEEAIKKIKELKIKNRQKPKQKKLFKVVNKVDQSTKLTTSGQQSRPISVNKVDLQNKGNKEKESIYAAEPQGEKIIKLKEEKQHKAHKQFIEFWYETTQKTRRIKPIITGKDARNLKRVLDLGILRQYELEQLALYFLAHYSFQKFSPSIATFLSAGIINGLMDRMQNNQEFWRELDEFTIRYLQKPKTSFDEKVVMVERLQELKKQLFGMPFSPSERTEIQEEVAAAERTRRII
jgi:biotin operon repressor